MSNHAGAVLSAAPDYGRDPVSAYRFAIDHTTRIVDGRARNHRNHVVSVVLLVLASIGTSCVGRSAAWLCALTLVAPVSGYYLSRDASLIRAWQARVLDVWVRREIDLGAFFELVSTVPGLPNETIAGMLGALPTANGIQREHELPASTREAAAAAAMALYKIDVVRLWQRVFSSAILASSLILAVVYRTPTPLGVGAVVLVAGFAVASAQRRHLAARLRIGTTAARGRPGFDVELFRALIADLPRSAFQVSERDELIRLLRAAT